MMILRRSLTAALLMAVILAGTGCSKQAKAKRFLAKADSDFQEKKYDAAELEYRSALQLSRLNPTAIRSLGLIYFDEGRYPQAYAFLSKANEQKPQDMEVENDLASIYLAMNKPQQAREIAQHLLTIDPASKQALLTVVNSVRSAADVADLRRYVQQLEHSGKDASVYHLALGSLALREKKLPEGEKELRDALASDPKSSEAYFLLAGLYILRNDLKQGGQNFQMAAQLAPLRSNVRLKYAEFQSETHNLEGAQKTLEEITSGAPDYIPAWTTLMKLFFAERKLDECDNVIHTILARDPSNLEAMVEEGNISLVKGDAARAVAQFEQVDSLAKNNPDVKHQLAEAYLMAGERSKASASLEQAIAINPNYAPAITLLAELNLRSGNSAAAVSGLTQLLQKNPENAQAHMLLANAYLAQQRPDDALAVYETMQKSFPSNPQVPLLIGLVHVQESQPAQARKAFEKSLELSPGFMPAVEQIINLDLNEKRYTAAMDLVKREVERTPQAADPLLLQSEIYQAQGETNQSETVLLKAISLNPSLPKPYISLAQLYVASHKQQEALDRLTTLVSKTNDLSAWMEIGLIRGQLKQYDQAAEAYQKALQVNPNFTPVLNNLAYLDSEYLGKLDQAYQLAEKARNLRPYDPNTADTLGWILYKQGQYSRAVSLLQDSAERQPGDPEVQMHLGMDYYMMDEEAPARLALQRALSSPKDFPQKSLARKRLAILAIDPDTATPAATETLQKAVDDDPNDPVALTRVATIDDRSGKADAAASMYQQVLKQNHENWPAMIKLAELYSTRLNEPGKALDLAKTAHQLAPEDPHVSLVLGRLLYHTADYQLALSLLEQCASQLPGQPSVLYDLAWAYYSVGRVAEADSTMQSALATGANWDHRQDAEGFLAMRAAAASYATAQAAASKTQTILQAHPTYVPALMVEGLIQEKQANYTAAEQTYQKVLASYPLFLPADRQLVLLYANHLHDDAKAIPLADKAGEAYPTDTELSRTLGLLAYRRGDYTRSAQLLRQSTQDSNNDGEGLYYLGMDYYRLKQTSDSKQALKRALALNIASPLAADAKQVLGQLK
jgi:tetratricopeptide (TPR) repeat protein